MPLLALHKAREREDRLIVRVVGARSSGYKGKRLAQPAAGH